MDLVALIIGVFLGLILGFFLAKIGGNSSKASSASTTNATEAEIKAIIGQKAQRHIQSSRESMQILEREIAKMSKSINQYEGSLTTPNNDDDSHSSFFGEHTSLFLRNAAMPANESETHQTTDSQPKDFANKGSGLFVGSAAESLKMEEKSNN